MHRCFFSHRCTDMVCFRHRCTDVSLATDAQMGFFSHRCTDVSLIFCHRWFLSVHLWLHHFLASVALCIFRVRRVFVSYSVLPSKITAQSMVKKMGLVGCIRLFLALLPTAGSFAFGREIEARLLSFALQAT